MESGLARGGFSVRRRRKPVTYKSPCINFTQNSALAKMLQNSPEPLDLLVSAYYSQFAVCSTFSILEHRLPRMLVRLLEEFKPLASIEVLEQQSFRLFQHLESSLRRIAWGCVCLA